MDAQLLQNRKFWPLEKISQNSMAGPAHWIHASRAVNIQTQRIIKKPFQKGQGHKKYFVGAHTMRPRAADSRPLTSILTITLFKQELFIQTTILEFMQPYQTQYLFR